MLEFLGFLALIALIFGISMREALTGFIGVIVWILIALAVLAFIGKLLETISSYFSPKAAEKRKQRREEEWEKKPTGTKVAVILDVLIVAAVIGFIVGTIILNNL